MAVVLGEFGVGTDLCMEPIQIPNQCMENKTCYFHLQKTVHIIMLVVFVLTPQNQCCLAIRDCIATGVRHCEVKV